MRTLKIAMLGLGTVGTGVVQIIESNAEQLKQKMNIAVEIQHIYVKNIDKKREINTERYHLTNQIDDVLNSDVDIVIEVMGGISPTVDYLKHFLKKGVHVITANKDLLAIHLEELETLAAENHVSLKYEASVAGGIPIVNAINNGLNANGIHHFMGIFNGTSNFILSKMSNEGYSFDEALQIATDLGYAEADPTADVDGLDAQRKVVITSYLAFNQYISLDDCPVEGIRNVTKEDIQLAAQLGYRIKLIGQARFDGQKVAAHVAPTCLPAHHQLAHVENEYNAIYIDGNAVGDTMYYGRGAGGLATGSAIVSDLLYIMTHFDTDLHTLPMHFESSEHVFNEHSKWLVIAETAHAAALDLSDCATTSTGDYTAIVVDDEKRLNDLPILKKYEIEGV